MLIMWNLEILFIVSLSAVLHVEARTRPLRDIDIENILSILQQQQHQNVHQHSQHKREPSLDSKSSGDLMNNEDNSHYGSLKSREVMDLIDQATVNKDVNDVSHDYKTIKDKKTRVNHKLHSVNDVDYRDEKHKPENNVPIDERTIKQILLYLKAQMKSKKPRKQALNKQKLLSNLAKSVKIQGDKHDRASLDDYSKIYIILNPQAVQKSSHKDSLSDIISKISSLSSASFTKERAEAKKDQQYKGFPVKEGLFSRRARRDSKEKYDPKDSLEDNYKQKRARNDHGSGRTAIPYIRHRGDIYERDN